MMRYIVTTFLALLLCVGSSTVLSGRGLDNSGIGIRGFAMAGAFYGIADDASAIFYNPGGLAFLDQGSWNAEVYGYLVNAKFRYSAGPVESESDEKFVIPGFFLSKTFKKWAFGIGTYVPFGGGGVNYKNFLGSPFDLESRMGLFAINPSAAYRITSKLSIGVGLLMYYGQIENRVMGVENTYSGLAGYGANIGILYKPGEKWGLGLSVRTQTTVKMDGTTKIMGMELDSEAEFKLPYYLSFGIGCKPNPDLTLGFSVVYMLWDNVDRLAFTTMGMKNEIITHYKNSWYAGLGMEYKFSNSMTGRLGTNYYQTSTTDEGLSPESNDVDLFSATVGLGFSITKAIEFNVTGIFTFGVEKEYNFQTFDQDHLVILAGFRFQSKRG